jgi:SAM-dependent methyltransferase
MPTVTPVSPSAAPIPPTLPQPAAPPSPAASPSADPGAAVSPLPLFEALLGYQQTAALKAAISLDLFTALAREQGALEPTAARVGAAPRGVRILCDYLCVQGFLQKEGARYRLPESTALFLTRDSPAYLGSMADFLASPQHMALYLEDPAAYVRAGGSAGLGNTAPDHPTWVTFARAMVPMMTPMAQALAQQVAHGPTPPRRVLDVAAGHGVFGIEVARAVPGAEVTAIDWAAVLQVAQENARAAGVQERYRTQAGSAFEVDWGRGYDLVLLTNFLHHFDAETNIGLLRRARESLAPGGRAIALEFVPNEDRVSPPVPAAFAFMMLGSTPRGDAYTAREFGELGRAAGFREVRVDALLPSPESLVTFA